MSVGLASGRPAVFTTAPPSLVLAEAAAAAVFTLAPLSLVLADAAAAAVFTLAPHSLVLAEAAAAAVFTPAPPSLVLAEAAAPAVFTRAPLSLVLAEVPALAMFDDCQRTERLPRGLARCVRRIAPHVLASLSAGGPAVCALLLEHPPRLAGSSRCRSAFYAAQHWQLRASALCSSASSARWRDDDVFAPHCSALDGVGLSAAWRPTPKAKATVYTEGDER